MPCAASGTFTAFRWPRASTSNCCRGSSKFLSLAPSRVEISIHGNVVRARRGIEIERDHDFAVVENARIRQRTFAVDRITEVDAVAGNLPKILPAVAQRRFAAPNRRDLRDAFVDRVGRLEEVSSGAVEGAPLTAEHAFAHIAIVDRRRRRNLVRCHSKYRAPLGLSADSRAPARLAREMDCRA